MASPPLTHQMHRDRKEPRFVVGVCAMDVKARSKPMRNILNRLMALGNFDVQIFGDKMILDEDIKDWPHCSFLISFFSTGFPLQKAIEYAKLRRPFLVNDLSMQELLFDRRMILSVLDAIKVPTPRRVVVNRSEPILPDAVWERLKRTAGLDPQAVRQKSKSIEQVDYDTLVVDGVSIQKPFVEKPMFGEDHNIYVYYHSTQGGGVRKLFRKVANKSSEYCPDEWRIRDDGSYIYEAPWLLEFMDVDNAEDVKVYTIGPDFAHAETRKSPVVDGVVRRNQDGKEVRYVTSLSDAEKEMARKVCVAFGQAVCGFDLLRVNGASYVIDVNGWSFVKGSEEYYDNCAAILKRIFETAIRQRRASHTLARDISTENQWRLKGFLAVIRHGDRTPKLKVKFNFTSPPFERLLNGSRDEIVLKGQADFQRVLAAVEEGLQAGIEKPDKLQQLKAMILSKMGFHGTKIQMKPNWEKSDPTVLHKLQMILKWGGDFTHAGRQHSQDLGENLRKELLLINRALLDDVKVYTASEQRVVETANTFTSAFLNLPSLPPQYLTVDKDMLDDSTAAKEQMDVVKAQLKRLFNDPAAVKELNPPGLPREMENPVAFVDAIVGILCQLRTTMRQQYQLNNADTIQEQWCCGETPALFRDRWEKLFKDFCDVGRGSFDPSKVSELYDSVKYDALHNRDFIEVVFAPLGAVVTDSSNTPPPPTAASPVPVPAAAVATSASGSNAPEPLNARVPPALARTRSPDNQMMSPTEGRSRASSGYISPQVLGNRYPDLFVELYRRSKILFDFVAPAEYGMDDAGKLEVSMLTSLPLVRKVIEDLRAARKSSTPSTRLYFTKESHVHTLLNIVFLCGLPKKIQRSDIDELDYLTQIVFELYERHRGLGSEDKEYSLRVSFSPGAYCTHIVDLQIDTRHTLSVTPRRDLTDHASLEEAFSCLQSQIKDQIGPREV
ncbi:inositol hexakisphosphate and diphosphoinositol-pentakisphosphate kinase [Sorochytrium milnesiophthora]